VGVPLSKKLRSIGQENVRTGSPVLAYEVQAIGTECVGKVGRF
jgi:hypothetical protein